MCEDRYKGVKVLFYIDRRVEAVEAVSVTKQATSVIIIHLMSVLEMFYCYNIYLVRLAGLVPL